MESKLEAEWCVARYTGNAAKLVIAHAQAGTGYRILQQGKDGAQSWVLAAFRRARTEALPDHLTLITDPVKITKLENARKSR